MYSEILNHNFVPGLVEKLTDPQFTRSVHARFAKRLRHKRDLESRFKTNGKGIRVIRLYLVSKKRVYIDDNSAKIILAFDTNAKLLNSA